MKYILVTGGVISGVGKGIIASSIGTILKAGGLRVTSIKIDPYINIDAGTFSPYEHGWYIVLDFLQNNDNKVEVAFLVIMVSCFVSTQVISTTKVKWLYSTGV